MYQHYHHENQKYWGPFPCWGGPFKIPFQLTIWELPKFEPFLYSEVWEYVSLNVSLTIKNITYAPHRICIRDTCIKGYFKEEIRLIVFIFLRKPLLVFLGSGSILGFCTGICWPNLVGIMLNIKFCIFLFHVMSCERTLSLVKMSLIFNCRGRTMIYITTPFRHICLF